jgi:hypothetical protein
MWYLAHTFLESFLCVTWRELLIREKGNMLYFFTIAYGVSDWWYLVSLFRCNLLSCLYWMKGFLWCWFCWIIILKFFVTSLLWGMLWVVTSKCGVDQYHLQLYGLDWLIYAVLRSVFIDVMWIELRLVLRLLWVIAGVFTLGRLHCLWTWVCVFQ